MGVKGEIWGGKHMKAEGCSPSYWWMGLGRGQYPSPDFFLFLGRKLRIFVHPRVLPSAKLLMRYDMLIVLFSKKYVIRRT